MPRMRKPAANKRGHSESKESLARREEIEKQLMGNSNDVKSIPEYLSADEKIYYEWLVNELEISGIIANLDKPLLEQTANCIDIMRQCDDILRREGILTKRYDKHGNENLVEHPAIKIKLNYMTKYAALCNQLGLSPAARAAIAGRQIEVKKEESDPLLKVLKGGL